MATACALCAKGHPTTPDLQTLGNRWHYFTHRPLVFRCPVSESDRALAEEALTTAQQRDGQ